MLFIPILCFVCNSIKAKDIVGVLEVPFEVVEGMIIISAHMNGSEGAFIFDTGSSQLLVHQDKHEINKRIELATADGTAWAEEVIIDHMKIGRVALSKVVGLQMDLSQVSRDVNKKINGVIGWNMLGNASIAIDYQKKAIIFGTLSQANFTEMSQYHVLKMDMKTMLQDLPMVAVKMGDQTFNFAFDTGAPLNVINTKSAQKLRKDLKKVNQVYFDDIRLSDIIKVENSLFRTEDLQALQTIDSNQAIDGILSVNSLNAQLVILDRKNDRIFIFWKKDKLNSKMASL
jgi:hypothetical protein